MHSHQTTAGAGITPGSPLLTGEVREYAPTALAAADTLATEVLSVLPVGSTLVSADTKVATPGAFSRVNMPALTPEAVVTALVAELSGTWVEVTARLLNEDGTAAIETRLAFLTDLPEPSGLLCPGSRQWITELGKQLNEDTEFIRLIESYDGTIGLTIGSRELHLRCYRGAVIEASPRSLQGADFIVTVSGAEFIELMQADHNAFMEAAMAHRVQASGSGYEYLRMVSALIRIIDIARGMSVTASYYNACSDHAAASTFDANFAHVTADSSTLEEV